LSNSYIGLKSMNALNINVFVLPTKLLPLLNYLCTAWSLIRPSSSCYSLRCHPLSTTYTFLSKNHQSLISLCITSSLESTSRFIPPALHKTPSWWCHSYKFTSHHSHPPSHIHCFSHSRLKTHLFYKSFPPQSASTHLDCLLGLYWTGLTRLNGFSFLFYFFKFWSCGRPSGNCQLNCQRSSAR